MTTLFCALTGLWALFIIMVAAIIYDSKTLLLGLMALVFLLTFRRGRV